MTYGISDLPRWHGDPGRAREQERMSEVLWQIQRDALERERARLTLWHNDHVFNSRTDPHVHFLITPHGARVEGPKCSCGELAPSKPTVHDLDLKEQP